MKPFRIIILIAFVFVTIASLTVFIGEKISTDTTIPTITVEGEIIDVSLNATDEELLKGVTAYDEKDKDLTAQIIVESISRFTEKGVSKVTYAVCDSDNNTAKATRKIRYKDYTSPRFKVSGTTCFSIYEAIDLREIITVKDCLEGNLTSEIIITSDNYSTTTPGAYSINVSVTNQKGDTAEIDLPLIVEDRPLSAPEITLSEYLVYAEKGSQLNFEDYIIDALSFEEESLRSSVLIESTVDFNTEGTYHVHYYVTDRNDVRGHSVLTVIVGEG